MRGTLAIWIRSPVLIVHLLVGLLAAAAVNCDFTGRVRAEPIARWWSRVLLRILNIRLRVSGQASTGACVTVANHVSWLDIPMLAACERTRFIAKSEIRDWPVAGWLANAAGTFYIRRGKGGARPLLDRLTPHLKSGGSVVLFPEGTTTDGTSVLPFHARLFGAAIEAGVAVQPVALRYSAGHGGKAVAPFVGDDDLVRHILRLLREPRIDAELLFCPAISSDGHDRDSLATLARHHVRDALCVGSEAAANAPTALAA